MAALRQKWSIRKRFYAAIKANMASCSEQEAIAMLQTRLDSFPLVGSTGAKKPGWKALLAQLQAEQVATVTATNATTPFAAAAQANSGAKVHAEAAPIIHADSNALLALARTAAHVDVARTQHTEVDGDIDPVTKLPLLEEAV